MQEGLDSHRTGLISRAQYFYEKALVLDPTRFDPLQFYAVVAQARDQHLKSLLFFEAAVRINGAHHATLNNRAVTLRTVGRFNDAEDSSVRSLQAKPDFPEAYLNLGLIYVDLGLLDSAYRAFERAEKIAPANAEVVFHQGVTLLKQEKFELALCCFLRVILIEPTQADAHMNSGFVYQQLKRYSEACRFNEKAVNLAPDNAIARYNQGVTFTSLERFEAALASYSMALHLRGQSAKTYFNMGCVFEELTRTEDARRSYEKALALDPQYVEACYNRANGLRAINKLKDALEAYDRVLRLRPRYLKAINNLGSTLHELGRFKEALIHFDRVLSLEPFFTDALHNRGISLQETKLFSAALASYAEAGRQDPQRHGARWNQSHLLLLLGRFDEGWPLYESRLELEREKKFHRRFVAPSWRGESSLKEKTILIYAEQGFGDSIQFMRYLPMVAALGAKVFFEAPKLLVPLISSAWEKVNVLERGSLLPECDFCCPLMSLPLAFKTTIETIPAKIPYVYADVRKRDRWRELTAGSGRLKVGLVWNGGFRPNQPEVWAINERRNITLRAISLYFQHPDITFYSLQKGDPGESEIRGREQDYWPNANFLNFTDRLFDFSDTAALIENLDLVITVDTSLAHLTGALGKPVWILNRYDTCWRWFEARDDSPWYPTARIFRQRERGNWDDVLQRVSNELALFHRRGN